MNFNYFGASTGDLSSEEAETLRRALSAPTAEAGFAIKMEPLDISHLRREVIGPRRLPRVISGRTGRRRRKWAKRRRAEKAAILREWENGGAFKALGWT